jgi:hypothetical protein
MLVLLLLLAVLLLLLLLGVALLFPHLFKCLCHHHCHCRLEVNVSNQGGIIPTHTTTTQHEQRDMAIPFFAQQSIPLWCVADVHHAPTLVSLLKCAT